MAMFIDLFRSLAKGPDIARPTLDAISPLRSLRDYEGNALKYIGEAPMDAETTDALWRIRRVFLDGNQRTRDIQTLEGAWEDRDNLPWRISQ